MYSRPIHLGALLVTCVFQLVHAQDFWPAAVPLSVKNPYFNTWVNTPASKGVPNLLHQPNTWIMQDKYNHVGFVRVDGVTYQWHGHHPGLPPANLTGLALTPTSTKFTMQAGAMDLTVTFLSPIELDDMTRQSYPFTYIYVDLATNDGDTHYVELYMDISGGLIASSMADNATMTYDTIQPSDSPQVVYHHASRMEPDTFAEYKGSAEDATLYLGMPYDNSVTYGIANCTVSRHWFNAGNVLNNTKASTQAGVTDNYPVFALAKNLGKIKSTTESTVFTLGLARDPIVQFKSAPDGSMEERYPFYRSKYGNAGDGIADFLGDFANARSRAEDLDQKIMTSAKNVSDNLANLVSLTTRSLMGSMDITYGSDPSDIMIFVKGMGSLEDAVSRRTNPVEQLYAAWPSIMYLNSTYGRYIMEPLLKYQSGVSASIPYAAPDLGNQYPVVAGGNAAKDSSIEESGNMLLMTWAQARFSGDPHIVDTYYDTLKTWADYLETEVLAFNAVTSGDGIKQSNQTNLALKGILGIRAMSELARIHEDDTAAESYASSAENLISQWKKLAVGSAGHLTSIYGEQDSWALMYNLYPDKWLGLNLIDQEIYDSQTSFIQTLHQAKYGLGFDSSQSTVAKSQWTMWTAATMMNNQARDALINSVHSRAATNRTGALMPLTYNTETGDSQGGGSSSALGAMFAPIALYLPIEIESGSGPPKEDFGENVGAIAGGVVGGVAVIGLIVLLLFLWRCRRRRERAEKKALMKPEVFAAYGYPAMSQRGESEPMLSKSGGKTRQHVAAVPAPIIGVARRFSRKRRPTTPGSPPVQPTPPPTRPSTTSSPGISTPTPGSGTSVPVSSSSSLTPAYSGEPDIRNEVQQLRREMEEMRVVYVPPPVYQT